MANRIIHMLIFCTSLYCYGMQQEAATSVFGTYLGKQITPLSLTILVPQLPEGDLLLIRAWLDVPRHKDLIKDLVAFNWPQAATYNLSERQRAINDLLLAHGLNNMSTWNVIFYLPGTNYVVQIAGFFGRVQILLSANVSDPARAVSKDKMRDGMCDDETKSQPATFQTISRVAHYLRAQEAINMFGLNKINLPKTYLVRIDEDIPTEATDNNCIVIQEKISNVVPVGKLVDLKLVRWITPEVVRQLFILAVYASLWDIEVNLLVDKDTKKFVISDFEQSIYSDPAGFFLKREAAALNLSRCGIDKLNQLFSDIPQLAYICNKFMKLTDEELKQIASGQLPENISH